MSVRRSAGLWGIEWKNIYSVLTGSPFLFPFLFYRLTLSVFSTVHKILQTSRTSSAYRFIIIPGNIIPHITVCFVWDDHLRERFFCSSIDFGRELKLVCVGCGIHSFLPEFLLVSSFIKEERRRGRRHFPSSSHDLLFGIQKGLKSNI